MRQAQAARATRDMKPSEAKLLQRAANNRWPVPDNVKQAAVARLTMIVASPTERSRTQVAAIRTLAEIDRLNVMRDQLDVLDKSKNGEPQSPVELHVFALDFMRLKHMSDAEVRAVIEERAAAPVVANVKGTEIRTERGPPEHDSEPPPGMFLEPEDDDAADSDNRDRQDGAAPGNDE